VYNTGTPPTVRFLTRSPFHLF